MNARKKFIDTCSEIYANAISKEVSKGGALQMSKKIKMDTRTPEGKKEFIAVLNEHVQTRLYGRKRFKDKRADKRRAQLTRLSSVASMGPGGVAGGWATSTRSPRSTWPRTR